MTKKYPLLTEENVRYWYELCDPPWSGHDIAKVVGCLFQTVYNFMRANNIRVLDYSESGKRRFSCPHKYEAFIKIRESPKWKRRQSKSQKNYWKDLNKRKSRSEVMKEKCKNKLSEYQKWLLYILYNHGEKFLTDLIKITKLKAKTINSSLENLINRNLIAFNKVFNRNSKNRNKIQKRHFITKDGISLLSKYFNSDQFEINDIQVEFDLPSESLAPEPSKVKEGE